jgi:hypothetical protein
MHDGPGAASISSQRAMRLPIRAILTSITMGSRGSTTRWMTAIIGRFLRTGWTKWFIGYMQEQFELTPFTPAGLRKLFENARMQVVSVIGKTILPVRQFGEQPADQASFGRLIGLEQHVQTGEDGARAARLQMTVLKPERVVTS